MNRICRREFLTTASAVLASGALPRAASTPQRAPNVVIFLLDDLGYHDLGCQGASDLSTPNVDALARSGARFTNWYSNAPVCAPSRAALLTGRFPLRAGVPNNGVALPANETTIASALKARGYRTGIIGKWHLGSTPETDPNAHGFDYHFGFREGCVDFYSHRYYWGEPRRVNFHDLWRNRTEIFQDGEYLTELITQEAKGFINAHRSEPFFLYVPLNAVHYPMHAPKKYVHRFPQLERERQMYAAMLSAADEGIGEILGLIEKLGLRDNTMIFFSCDHGATREPRAGMNQQPAKGGSNSPLRGYKFSLFEGGIRVPAIMRWPGVIPPNQVIHEVGMHMDLLPTILEAAGAPLPADRTIDGRNILPVATSHAKSPYETIFWSSEGQLAVRRGPWKLVINGMIADGTPQGREKLQGEDGLFLSNLEEDIGETRNRSRDYPARAEELAHVAREWLSAVNSAGNHQ
jgi:arylsulfatase A-like enzyme